MVQKWFTEFRCGRMSMGTILSPGRPNEFTTPESQLSVWSILCIHIVARDNSVQDECRDCSQPTINTFVLPLRRKIWPILTAIQKSFCIDLGRWIKYQSTTILWNHVKGQSSELNLIKMHQSVQKRNNRLGKLWIVFFKMHLE